MRTRPSTERPNLRNRGSRAECCRSDPSSAFVSRNTVTASSKVTPCLSALIWAFRGSHSNASLVYTQMLYPMVRGEVCRAGDRPRIATPLRGVLQPKIQGLFGFESRHPDRLSFPRTCSTPTRLLSALGSRPCLQGKSEQERTSASALLAGYPEKRQSVRPVAAASEGDGVSAGCKLDGDAFIPDEHLWKRIG